MTDEHPQTDNPGNADGDKPAVKPPTNPETPAGADGVSADGYQIPANEMIENREEGANPEALARFREQAAIFARYQNQEFGQDALMALLSEIGQRRLPYRPAVMTRGDVAPNEYLRLNRIYTLLKGKAARRQRLTAFGHGLHCLLSGIIDRGYVVTDSCRIDTCAAYGYDADTIVTFDIALAVVWTVATAGINIIPQEMSERVPNLLQEIGLDVSDLT